MGKTGIVAAAALAVVTAVAGCQGRKAEPEPASRRPEIPIMIVEGSWQPEEGARTTVLPDGRIGYLPKIQPLWKDKNISEIAQLVSRMSGREIIVDPRVCATFNYDSPTQIWPDELYPLFLSLVRDKGLRAIENGNVTRIVPRKKPGKGWNECPPAGEKNDAG